MKRSLLLICAAVLVLAAPAFAVDLRVTDSSGVEVVVRSVIIDYSGILGSDTESQGIRVSLGEALITAVWTDIESITVTGRDAAAGRLSVDIQMRGGKKVPATLIRKGRMKLTGKSDLGDYSIDLERIKKIITISAK